MTLAPISMIMIRYVGPRPVFACLTLFGLAVAVDLRAETPSAAATPTRLRVLSYNIHHAAGMDGKVDLERIAGVIRAAKPDLVALQEVDQSVPRSGKTDQLDTLARLTGMQGVFGKSIPLGGGAYGNALLSRLPVMAHQVLALPGAEPRSVLVATLRMREDDPASEFRFLVTHFSLQAKNRIKSVAVISEFLKTESIGRALLAGDLNATRTGETMLAAFKDWTDSSTDVERATVPARTPKNQIDYLLYRPLSSWRVISVTVLDEAMASDHRPLLVVLELE